MLEIAFGTVGLAILLIALGAWIFMRGRHWLEEPDVEQSDLRVVRPPGPLAADRERRDIGDVLTVLSEKRRLELHSRREATAKARGPARLTPRGDVPNNAA